MAKSANQKIKMLRIYELLRMESDESHPLSTNDIIEALSEQGIHCERKSLYNDIDLLKEYGFNIETILNRQNYYYLAQRELNLCEIRFLLDATQSAAFIPKEQTKETCAAIAMLAGSHKAEVLDRDVICFDKVKHSNAEVFDTIQCIDRAIENNLKISFRYFTLGVDGKRTFYDENRRIVNPIGLIFNNGYYYLCCYKDDNEKRTYRVDRMIEAKVEDIEITPSKLTKSFRTGEAKNMLTAFAMWDGEAKDVTLRVLNKNAGDIYDKFGEDIRLIPDGDYFKVKVKVNISPVFLGWCASYGNEIQILSPDDVKDELIKLLMSSINQYKTTKE